MTTRKSTRLPILTCGVYVFYSGATVVYVGRSYSIAYRRLGVAVARFSAKYKLTHIEFYKCTSKAEAYRLEGELIHELVPLENKQLNGAKYRDRNRMSRNEEIEIYQEIIAIVRKHGTTMKRVNRIMREI